MLQQVGEEIPAERHRTRVSDTFPVSKYGIYVAKVMFTKWETMSALPGSFPL